MRSLQRALLAATLFLLSVAAIPTASAANSVTNEFISNLNEQLLYLAVPIAVLVEGILIYTVWRFRANGDDDGTEPEPTRENRQLEITWTVATALVLLFVGTASFTTLAQPSVSSIIDDPQSDDGPPDAPADAVDVDIVAEQWEFTFEYPDENVTTSDALVLPENQSVYMYVTSTDVIHSVHVPALGLKQDAIPGETHLLRTTATEQGEYRLYCAELCGQGHPEMLSTVRVVDEDEYESWLEEQRSESSDDGN
ncbi:cytochrome c oxidase subunit II [Halostagnicola kamekurae]|uniref:cytochrome-c oxidase n=1 Tax=Halostagnicola kamekurae TaxID=619731 RepID=A0A1I6TGK7_9EURY|nr:cytochrome c oxidase subunit II [Halostagnicola kamekurae]SFS88311.1 cytochrome c oxidase subunit 2 [Halostagnicola kamekurae]